MSQSGAVQRSALPSTRAAGSGAGAPLVPTFHCATCTSTRETCTPSSVRTVICAWPGITPGMRTLTRTGYGPALPS